MELDETRMKKVKKIRIVKGFTLVEIVIVVSLLALISVIGGNFFFSALFGSSKAEALKEVKQNGEFALKVMEESIKNAYGFVSCDPNSIVVKNKDNQNNNYHFEIVDNIGRIASDSSHLTSERVNVTNFSINCITSSGVPPKVIISYTVSQSDLNVRVEKKATYDFKTTVTMRNY